MTGGAVAIVVAIATLFFLLGFAALAIDTGYLFATKNELQNIADAAALAAAGEPGNQLSNGGTLDIKTIKDVAKEIGAKNQAGGKYNITIDSANDIQIGTWDQDADPPFDRTDDHPSFPLGGENAVRVAARRDGLANSPVSTFFGGILGVNAVNVSADATAALDAPGKIESSGISNPSGDFQILV